MSIKEEIKRLALLIVNGQATIDDEIKYYNLFIGISNRNTQAGQRSIARAEKTLKLLKNSYR